MRKIYQTEEFTQQFSDLEAEIPQARNFLKGLKYKLSRNPEFGEEVRQDPPVWFIGMPDVVEQALGVSYTFDDECVILLGIWVSE